MGHVIDRGGLRPDSAKIEAILKLPEPTDVIGVRAFLGAVNYYRRFVKSMRELRYPLDCLLKGDKPFRWTEECRTAFEKFKAVLSSDLLLTHYDPRQDIIVSADASSIGLGATISHKYADGSVRVVQHASRALTKTEQAYSQIDREALAIVFAITKFHKMIFGRRFLLQTDHKPLLKIFGSKKGIPAYTANRLQRFADNDLAYVAVNALSIFPLLFNEVAEATQRDYLLRNVKNYIVNGWPKKMEHGSELASFYRRREWLSNVKGCILFGERVVIPRILQKRCLMQLHKGHPGIVRMKAIARSYVYWPHMDEDIIETVGTCTRDGFRGSHPRFRSGSGKYDTDSDSREKESLVPPESSGIVRNRRNRPESSESSESSGIVRNRLKSSGIVRNRRNRPESSEQSELTGIGWNRPESTGIVRNRAES